MMKSISAFLLLFSLFLFVNLNDARGDPRDYWKSIMKDQPIPEAIKGLLHRDDLPYASDAEKKDHFLKDFDVTPNAIIYHAHVEDKEEKKSCVEDFEQKSKTELNLFQG